MRILFFLTALLLPLHAEDPEAPKVERKLLSSHTTLAVFEGVKFQACRHRTSLCPDKCGHAGKVATFKITKYLDYKKPGKYGDAKGKTFRTMIVDQLDNTKVPEKTLALINSLEKGDAVELSWNHDYVTENGSSYPVRTITKLTKVKEEAPKTEEE
jgi:hypothetical protein